MKKIFNTYRYIKNHTYHPQRKKVRYFDFDIYWFLTSVSIKYFNQIFTFIDLNIIMFAYTAYRKNLLEACIH